MAIGRSEDRDTPWDPMVLRHHFSVWDPIRVTHLGQRSSDRTYKGRTYDCNRPSRSAAAPAGTMRPELRGISLLAGKSREFHQFWPPSTSYGVEKAL